MGDLTSTIIVIAVMLLLSGFFSGMEIAFLSKNRLKLEIDRKQSPFFDRIANTFSRNPGQYITTILVGNNIALVVYSLSMSVFINYLFELAGLKLNGSILIESAISTIIIIFVAEFLPKSIFRSNPNFYYRIFAPLIFFFYIILYPISRLTTLLSLALLRILGRKRVSEDDATGFDRHDLASLIESGESDKESDKEIRLFQNALDFADLRVRDSMTPRVDIDGVDVEKTSIEELAAKFNETKYTRLFVWRTSIDNIIGYVNIKSIFQSPKKIADIVKTITYVPESMPLNLLMQNLIKHKRNIAVVIDEFGGTAGVISLEDVLEQIFGEIEDEHDEQEMIEKQLEDGSFVLSGRLEVKHLNDTYSLDIEESDDYDTLAGFVIFENEGIPAAGEQIRIGRFEIKILRTTRSRIDLLKLKIIE